MLVGPSLRFAGEPAHSPAATLAGTHASADTPPINSLWPWGCWGAVSDMQVDARAATARVLAGLAC